MPKDKLVFEFRDELSDLLRLIKDTASPNQKSDFVRQAMAIMKRMDQAANAPLRIVCAANKGPTGLIFCGARHGDAVMRMQKSLLGFPYAVPPEDQGFIDNRGAWWSRTEAWKIATEAGQILHRCGGDDTDGGTLYSENLY